MAGTPNHHHHHRFRTYSTCCSVVLIVHMAHESMHVQACTRWHVQYACPSIHSYPFWYSNTCKCAFKRWNGSWINHSFDHKNINQHELLLTKELFVKHNCQMYSGSSFSNVAIFWRFSSVLCHCKLNIVTQNNESEDITLAFEIVTGLLVNILWKYMLFSLFDTTTILRRFDMYCDF